MPCRCFVLYWSCYFSSERETGSAWSIVATLYFLPDREASHWSFMLVNGLPHNIVFTFVSRYIYNPWSGACAADACAALCLFCRNKPETSSSLGLTSGRRATQTAIKSSYMYLLHLRCYLHRSYSIQHTCHLLVAQK
jgi:hypothetical protein